MKNGVRRVPEMERYGEAPVLARIRGRRVEGGVDRVRLRGRREIHDGLREGEFPLRRTEEVDASLAASVIVSACGSARPMSSTAMRTIRRAR